MPIKYNDKAARQRLARNLTPAIQAGAMAIAAAIQHNLAPYPSPSGKKQPPKSEKQRRYVFVLIRAGKIPYRRTGQFGQRWNIRPLSLGAILENRRDKAALIVGRLNRPGDQAGYHRGTWTNVDSAVNQTRSKFNDLMSDAIGKVLLS